MNIKDVRIQTHCNRPNVSVATLYLLHAPIPDVIAWDLYTPEVADLYHEGSSDPNCPLIGVLTEDGEHCVDDLISGAERLRVFLRWVAMRYEEEFIIPRQLSEYWKEFEKYEFNHVLDLYARPVDADRKEKYAPWAQVQEWKRHLIEKYGGDDDDPEDDAEAKQEMALSQT
jgi:hypothetical protein